jgi:hypothetical protein
MTDSANETMSAEEYRQKYGDQAQPQLDGFDNPADEHDFALAIDPGRDTGLAWTDGEHIRTKNADFTLVLGLLLRSMDQQVGGPSSGWDETLPSNTCLILEAPYKSRQSMGAQSAVAYNSGQVAREAELLKETCKKIGYDVIEHDPARQGPKWDSSFARKIVGDWEGPDNEHCRDAIRLLFFYEFL